MSTANRILFFSNLRVQLNLVDNLVKGFLLIFHFIGWARHDAAAIITVITRAVLPRWLQTFNFPLFLLRHRRILLIRNLGSRFLFIRCALLSASWTRWYWSWTPRSVVWVTFDDQIGDFLVVVDNFNRSVYSFAHLFVRFCAPWHVRCLQVRQKCRHQVCYSCERLLLSVMFLFWLRFVINS